MFLVYTAGPCADDREAHLRTLEYLSRNTTQPTAEKQRQKEECVVVRRVWGDNPEFAIQQDYPRILEVEMAGALNPLRLLASDRKDAFASLARFFNTIRPLSAQSIDPL
jgi:hypothetical protein